MYVEEEEEEDEAAAAADDSKRKLVETKTKFNDLCKVIDAMAQVQRELALCGQTDRRI